MAVKTSCFLKTLFKAIVPSTWAEWQLTVNFPPSFKCPSYLARVDPRLPRKVMPPSLACPQSAVASPCGFQKNGSCHFSFCVSFTPPRQKSAWRKRMYTQLSISVGDVSSLNTFFLVFQKPNPIFSVNNCSSPSSFHTRTSSLCPPRVTLQVQRELNHRSLVNPSKPHPHPQVKSNISFCFYFPGNIDIYSLSFRAYPSSRIDTKLKM